MRAEELSKRPLKVFIYRERPKNKEDKNKPLIICDEVSGDIFVTNQIHKGDLIANTANYIVNVLKCRSRIDYKGDLGEAYSGGGFYDAMETYVLGHLNHDEKAGLEKALDCAEADARKATAVAKEAHQEVYREEVMPREYQPAMVA